MSVRARQILLLIGPVSRTVPWVPIAAAVVVSTLGMIPALGGAAEPASQVWGLRIAAVMLGAGASFAIVDPMALLSVTPTPRWLRQWLRTIVALLPVTGIWLAMFLLAGASMSEGSLPFGDLAAEASVCGLAGLVGAAVAARRGHSPTTALAGPAMQGGLMAATLFLTGRRSPWPLPTTAEWETVHGWWRGALPVLLVMLLAAHRDLWPLRRSTRRPSAACPEVSDLARAG